MWRLKYKALWSFIGYIMIAFVIYSTLDTTPVQLVEFEGSDKFLHITAYFGLMGWFLQIYHTRKMQIILACGFVSMGIILEFLQALGGVRFFEIYDMLANSSGVLLAWSLIKTPFSQLLFYFESKILACSK